MVLSGAKSKRPVTATSSRQRKIPSVDITKKQASTSAESEGHIEDTVGAKASRQFVFGKPSALSKRSDDVLNEGAMLDTRSVKFNQKVLEASIGGTENEKELRKSGSIQFGSLWANNTELTNVEEIGDSEGEMGDSEGEMAKDEKHVDLPKEKKLGKSSDTNSKQSFLNPWSSALSPSVTRRLPKESAKNHLDKGSEPHSSDSSDALISAIDEPSHSAPKKAPLVSTVLYEKLASAGVSGLGTSKLARKTPQLDTAGSTSSLGHKSISSESSLTRRTSANRTDRRLQSHKSIPAVMGCRSMDSMSRVTSSSEACTVDPEQVPSMVSVGSELRKKKNVCKRSSSSHLTPDMEPDSCSVTVAVRLRPFNSRELEKSCTKRAVNMSGQQTTVTTEAGQTHTFTYDHCFCSFDPTSRTYADQEMVYKTLAQPLLDRAFGGYNICLFAYGQTGSGKSYSMMGHGDEGVIPQFCEELFERVEKCSNNIILNIEINFFEIYNEKIHDLLTSPKSTEKIQLRVREHPETGPYVEDLTSYSVKSYSDISTWIALGNKQRATASTGMNERSSRSHSIFSIILTQTESSELEDGEMAESTTVSRISLVDLAGSERQSTAQTSGVRLREGASINKSLLTLGKVVSLLSDASSTAASGGGSGKKSVFVPYRDSMITWLLKDSLGGNSRTTMLATVSPSVDHAEETLSTLRYAAKARHIINVARINEDPSTRLVRELRSEIDKLRGQLSGGSSEGVNFTANLAEIESLRQSLERREREMLAAQAVWKDRMAASTRKRQEEQSLLEQSGIMLKMDRTRPCLVNLNEDPQLSEILLYVLRDGITGVGLEKFGSNADIQLSGTLIKDQHCIFKAAGSRVSLVPQEDTQTYVNGEHISGTVCLTHGDRVVIGDQHYFRFNNPLEACDKTKTTGSARDFEYAKQELLRVQNDKLRADKDRECVRVEKLSEQLLVVKSSYQDQIEQQKVAHEHEISHLKSKLKEKTQEQRLIDEQKIEEIQQQKRKLELELEANQKQLKMRALATQKAEEGTRTKRAKILDQLSQEKEKLAKKLMADKLRRGAGLSTPLSTPLYSPLFTPQRKLTAEKSLDGRGDTESSVDLYRTAVLLREANKIAHCMELHMLFTAEESSGLHGEFKEACVKVIDRGKSQSTLWSHARFKQQLNQMREAYSALSTSKSEPNSEKLREDLSECLLNQSDDVWVSATSTQNHLVDSFSKISHIGTTVEKMLGSPACTKRREKNQKYKSHGSSTTRSLYGQAAQFLSAFLQSEDLRKTNPLELILQQCHVILQVTSQLGQASSDQLEIPCSSQDNEVSSSSSLSDTVQVCLTLTSSIQSLSTLSSCLSPLLDESSHISVRSLTAANYSSHSPPLSHPTLSAKVSSMQQALRESMGITVRLLQSRESGSGEEGAVAAITKNLLTVSHLCGVLSVMGDQRVPALDGGVCFIGLSDYTVRAVIKGGSDQMHHCCHTVREKVTESLGNLRASSADKDRIYNANVDVHVKLHGFLESFECTLPHKSDGDHEDVLSPALASLAYRRCVDTTKLLMDIAEALSSLAKPILRQGAEYDRATVYKGGETIKRRTRELHALYPPSVCEARTTNASTVRVTLFELEREIQRLLEAIQSEGKVEVRRRRRRAHQLQSPIGLSATVSRNRTDSKNITTTSQSSGGTSVSPSTPLSGAGEGSVVVSPRLGRGIWPRQNLTSMFSEFTG